MEDILTRLKATTKIYGAYPRDIEDSIKELTRYKIALTQLMQQFYINDDNDLEWMYIEGTTLKHILGQEAQDNLVQLYNELPLSN